MTQEAPRNIGHHEPASGPIPESPFAPQRLAEILNLMPVDAIVAAMSSAGVAEQTARQIMAGERPRTLGLAGQYPFLYQSPIEMLRDKGVIPEEYDVTEIGLSMGTTWVAMPKELQPRKVSATDHPHIVSGAIIATNAFREAGLTNTEFDIRSIDDDNNAPLPNTHLTFLSLVSQYGVGEVMVVELAQREGVEVVVNSDFAHGPVLITEEQVEAGNVIPITAKRTGGASYGWKLGEEIPQTEVAKKLMGRYFEAEFEPLEDFEKGGHVAEIVRPGDKRSTIVTILEERGQMSAEGWGLMPRPDATEEDMETMSVMRETYHDLCRGIEAATGGDQAWDGNAVLGVAAHAATKDLYTAIMLTTAPLAPQQLLAMLNRNNRELGILYEADQGLRAEGREGIYLAHIGPDKKYKTVNEFLAFVRSSMAPDGICSKFTLTSPPTVTTITTPNKAIFEKLIG